MVSPIVTHRCESWTIKKVENKRIDASELWCWRRLLRVPWRARWSKQSTLKLINLEYWLEGLLLKLKLQYFGYLMQRAKSLERTLMLVKMQGRRMRRQQRVRWLDGITDPMDMSLRKVWKWWGTGKLGMLQSMGSLGFRHGLATEQQKSLTEKWLFQSLQLPCVY